MASLRNAEENELGTQYDNEQLTDISADKPTTDAPQDEDEEHRWIRRAKNAKRAQRRCNAQSRAYEPRDLNKSFAAVADREYRTPIGAIAEAALLAQQLPKATVLDPTRARATRWATPSVLHSKSALEI
jgi:signal transduction histidine kinase